MSLDGTPSTVFLCHGAGGDAESMRELAEELRVVHGLPARTLSYPGRLDTPGPALERVEELAAFVRAEVQAALGSTDLPHVVLGHSMGGAVALEYALHPPPGLVGLVLVSTGARLRVHPSILDFFARGPDEAEGAGHSPPPAAALARSLELSTRTPHSVALADWRAANAFERMTRVHEITTPTLVLVGDADLLTPPKYARFLNEQIAGSTLSVLPGAGHNLPTEHAARVAELSAAFLRTGGRG